MNLTGVGSFDNLNVHKTSNFESGTSTLWDETTLNSLKAPTLETAHTSGSITQGIANSFDVKAITTDGILSFAVTVDATSGTSSIYTLEEPDVDGVSYVPSLTITSSAVAQNEAPTLVENFTAAEGVAAVNLTWDASVDNDGTVASYNVYRRANQNFLFGDPIANVTSGTAYTDAAADTDHHYQYVITCLLYTSPSPRD